MYSRSVSEGSVRHGGEGMALEGCAKGCLHQGRPLLKEEARRAQSLKYSTFSSFPLSGILNQCHPTGKQGFRLEASILDHSVGTNETLQSRISLVLDVLGVPWLVSASLPFSLPMALNSAFQSPSNLPLLPKGDSHWT